MSLNPSGLRRFVVQKQKSDRTGTTERENVISVGGCLVCWWLTACFSSLTPWCCFYFPLKSFLRPILFGSRLQQLIYFRKRWLANQTTAVTINHRFKSLCCKLFVLLSLHHLLPLFSCQSMFDVTIETTLRRQVRNDDTPSASACNVENKCLL